MSYIEKERLIRADIESIENRVRHAFNQGYDLGYKKGKERATPQEQETSGDDVVSRDVVKEPTTKNNLGVDCISRDVVKNYIQAHIHEIITESGEDKNKHTNRVLRSMIHGVNCMPSVTPQEQTTKIEESNFSQEQYLADIQNAYDCGKSVIDKIRGEIKKWYWQADKQALAKDPCVVDAMINLFIKTIDKYKAKEAAEDNE